MSALIKYSGSCHCGDIKFEVLAPRELQVVDCKYVPFQSSDFFVEIHPK